MAGNKRRSVGNAKKPTTRRINVQMTDGAIQRLMLHSVMLRRNPGDLLSELVEAGLRQFKVQTNTAVRATVQESASSAVEVESAPSAEAA
jgi:hypothetical protein